jgi:hypothetical protein
MMTLQFSDKLRDRASRIRNDSSVAGDNVKEALDALAAGAGGIVGPDPSQLNSVAVWADATGETLRDSDVIIHATSNDKLETNATFQAWTTAADGSTVTLDLDQSDQHDVTYAGNRTLAVDNESAGQTIHVLRIQDGTGNRVESWWSNISWNHGIAPVQDPTAAGWDLVTLKCKTASVAGSPGTPGEWVEVSRTSSAPRKAIKTVTYGSTTTFDLRKSHLQSVVLAGNPTLELQAGCYGEGNVRFGLQLVQDAVGGRTVTWGTSFGTIHWTATGGVAPTLPTAANASCWLVFVCTDTGTPAFECVGATGVQSFVVSDAAYNATTWNDVTTVAPSKNTVRDKFEAMESAYTAAIAAAVVGLLDDKGNLDCSANPNYPAASKGDVYTVSGPGKIGGGSGVDVEVGDVFRALADNAGGTQASVGSSWAVVQANLVGALVSGGPLGTPSSGTLTSCTGLPVSGVTGITAAAQTVLDDTTVAAMVDTIGGAASTGTGGLVRKTDSTLNGTTGMTAAVIGVTSYPTRIFGDGWIGTELPTDVYACWNAYYNSGFKARATGGAIAYYGDGNGNLDFRTAPSASAGAALTFTQRMRLAQLGSLLLGTTTAPSANASCVFVLGDNGATDPTLGASTCGIYQKSGEIYHKDAAGNVTLTSPHAIDEAIAAGLDIPDDDMHPSIGKSYNQYTGWGTYTYRDQVVPFQIPDNEKLDWTESQLAVALAREQDRFQYEVEKSLHGELETETPFDRVKPTDYVPVDPPKWMQKRGVSPVNKQRISKVVADRKAELIVEVPLRVSEAKAARVAAKQAPQSRVKTK